MTALTKQDEARIVELAEEVESDLRARAWHAEEGYQLLADIVLYTFVRPASIEAFRIAQGGAT
jgi:hypothetical protein